MRDYGIIRQNPAFRDMFAFPFLNTVSFDDIDTINEVYPEWQENKYYGGYGEAQITTPYSYNGMKCGIYHNEVYDILIVGISRISGLSYGLVTGTRDSDTTGNLTNYHQNLGAGTVGASFVIFSNTKDKYLYLNQDMSNPLPVIGIKLKDNSRSLRMLQEQMKKSEKDPEPVKEQEPEEEPVTKSTRERKKG